MFFVLKVGSVIYPFILSFLCPPFSLHLFFLLFSLTLDRRERRTEERKRKIPEPNFLILCHPCPRPLQLVTPPPTHTHQTMTNSHHPSSGQKPHIPPLWNMGVALLKLRHAVGIEFGGPKEIGILLSLKASCNICC